MPQAAARASRLAIILTQPLVFAVSSRGSKAAASMLHSGCWAEAQKKQQKRKTAHKSAHDDDDRTKLAMVSSLDSFGSFGLSLL